MEYEQTIGEKITIEDYKKNAFAWFSFEEVARTVVYELGIDTTEMY